MNTIYILYYFFLRQIDENKFHFYTHNFSYMYFENDLVERDNTNLDARRLLLHCKFYNYSGRMRISATAK